MTKRQKIIVSSVALSVALLSTGFIPVYFYVTYKAYFILFFGLAATILSLWALWEGLSKFKAVVLLILPTLFTLAVANYYFLLTARWMIIFVAIFFGLTFYTLLLSQNVFNVASIRTIPLYRVASFTCFVITAVTSFLLFNVIYSLEMVFIGNAVAAFLLSFPLALQVLWTIDMENINKVVLTHTLIISLIVAEMSLVLSFWPISRPIASLMLATALSVHLGISTHALRERLNRGVVWEYLGWGMAVFLVALFTTSWRG